MVSCNCFCQFSSYYTRYLLLLALFIETVISGILMRKKPSVIALHPQPAHTPCNGHYASNIGGVSTEQCCHCGSSSLLSSPPRPSPGCCRGGSPDIRVTYLHTSYLHTSYLHIHASCHWTGAGQAGARPRQEVEILRLLEPGSYYAADSWCVAQVPDTNTSHQQEEEFGTVNIIRQ